MRPETKEYRFDWMLWTMFLAGSRLKNGTEKEYQNTLGYVPYFSGILEALYDTGAPGKAFLECLAKYTENIVFARERGRKTAATSFCFSPAILHAMDIDPICFEVISVMQTFPYKRGSSEFLDFCNEAGFTETSCSSQRGSMGAFLAGMASEIDMIVTDTPGVCDTNANAFAFAATYLKKPFFTLDIPSVLVDGRTDEFQLADFRALIEFLERNTGKKLDEDKLRDVLREMAKQDDMLNELEDLARIVPGPLPGAFNLMIYASRFMFTGMKECTAVIEAMLHVARENAAKGISALSGGVENMRAFFCYIDHYTHNMDFFKYFDERGICYQGNMLSRSWSCDAPHVDAFGTEAAAYEIDTTDLDSMLRSIAAQNSRMPMVKSIRGPYDAPDMWLQDTLSLAKLYSADCVIYNGTPGCRNTWGMVKLLARDTEKAGFPTFIMYGDAFDDRVESWEATKDRLDEFFRVRRLLA
ncbi:MAG: 2-hydroxyacyl-CoA dehydratase [Spirochaetes bacterium]|nr:2-hydroxyacyl-CoA dehydratase [Spirochaetota bacterium]